MGSCATAGTATRRAANSLLLSPEKAFGISDAMKFQHRAQRRTARRVRYASTAAANRLLISHFIENAVTRLRRAGTFDMISDIVNSLLSLCCNVQRIVRRARISSSSCGVGSGSIELDKNPRRDLPSYSPETYSRFDAQRVGYCFTNSAHETAKRDQTPPGRRNRSSVPSP